ncbi:MAG: SDR family NAD(P)-dependent oxidoreductase [bacterium]|jgi:short-subunit dehydrogenase|nr:SDR family NAD(P)-dependent oxidoreductase [Candidatus Neomarinimicrobiota bacterium]HIL86648.1 SDR family NAD(P)-dependent oxidoreductase [Candidatus Neomarinimicrobiota bacterium]
MNIYITGASSGMGEYIAYEYAKHGVHLALCARRKEKLDNIANKCRQMGAEVTTYSIDVTDQHSTKESIDDFLSKITKIDLVIANAGRGDLDALHKGDPTIINEVIKVNVIGVQNTVLPFIPIMLKQDSGHIALVGSVASHIAWAGGGAYSASKFAVRALSESWRKTLPTTIDVTLICPGFVESEMTDPVEWTPFIIKTDIAAKKIVNALNKKKKMFIFPWQMRIVIAFKGLLDIVMTNAARKMHKK